MIRTYTKRDVPFIVNSHYELYHQEFQYDETFKAFIQSKVEGFLTRGNQRESIWIVEIDGENKGSIAVNEVDGEMAQLGLFLMDPTLRGKGFGQKLIQTVIQFCIDQNYQSIILFTNEELVSARTLYQKNGFECVKSWVDVKSSKELVEEKWKLNLISEPEHK
ncbi:GNAT family N-acetyltransferase [Alkalicoccobacillus gibsonii]|uniref:GNAT family N-acetyltransferase n=1 Tax=Alkalicoccobacillus gibsonii TaxID=79881 RepID=UPI0019317255|nr:GNAT family N-acetyltransferase [Alkalicoccobacillus gibsonii]MBM0066869.1 GNAT family N-acetyltransferase [Alkalicoccobacillus gibsonii]